MKVNSHTTHTARGENQMPGLIKRMTESDFQNLCSKFVSHEVHCCVSTEISYIINRYEDEDAPYKWADVDNHEAYTFQEIEATYEDTYTREELDNIKDAYEDESNDLVDAGIQTGDQQDRNTLLCNKIEEIDDLDPEQQEIYEWWKCNSMLISNLKDAGEPVIKFANIWGRTTTGQSISIDEVIRSIVKKLHNVEIIKE